MDINKILMEDDSIEKTNQIKTEDNEIEKIDVKALLQSNINKNSVSMSFETLVSKFNSFHFVLPKYQRKYVWSREQIANLALSLIKNVPIPPIYVYFNDNDNKYVILDGQQRVISLFLYYYNLNLKRTKKGNKILIDFYELLKDITEKDEQDNQLIDIIKNSKNYLSNITKYKIEENNQEVDITYSDLKPDSKRLLGSKYIEVVFLDIKSKEKEKVYSNIFKLLNSAGTPLKPQEIRNGVFQSFFYDKLHELNNNNSIWRNLYGEKHETNRDVELLLRFLTIDYYTELNLENKKINFKINPETKKVIYKGSYHTLLDDFSQKCLKLNNEEVMKKIKNLELFLKKFNLKGSVLENRKNKTVNHLLLEALYVAFIKSENNIKEFNETIISLIVNNDRYKYASQNSTSNKSNIEERINVAYEVLTNEKH